MRYGLQYADHSTRRDQVVGAPANYMAALQAFGIHVGQELLPNTSSRYISETTWSLTDPRDCQ
jgi:hypothetical protein